MISNQRMQSVAAHRKLLQVAFRIMKPFQKLGVAVQLVLSSGLFLLYVLAIFLAI